MKRPNLLVYRGVIETRAMLVQPGLRGEREARRRVIGAWEHGTLVYSIDDGYLMIFPRGRWTDTRHAEGLPLTATGERLMATDLGADVLEAMPLVGWSVARLRGGAVQIERIAESAKAEPAAWISTDLFSLVEVGPLSVRTIEPVVALRDSKKTLEQILPIAGRKAEEITEIRAALERAMKGGTANPGRGESVGGFLRGLAGTVASIFGALARDLSGQPSSGAKGSGRPASSWFGSMFEWLRRFVSDGSGAATSRPNPEEVDRGSGIFDNLGAAFRRAFGRLLRVTRLSKLIGRKQAEFLARTMDLFERGDIMEALRNAIPLGGALDGPASPAFGVPDSRHDLRILPWQRSASSSVYLSNELFAQLRRLYLDAFERLSASGRHEEAAFVLAELVHDDLRAVSYLEGHGKLTLAAELAEGRKLAPEIIVRQWFLAGDRERAIAIARKHGVFAQAVARLEQTHRDEAEELRSEWGDLLARAGDYAGAIDAMWPAQRLRERARDWIDPALAQGGATRGRMLATWLALEPEKFEAQREQILELVNSEGPDLAAARAAFAARLLELAPSPSTNRAAAVAAKAVLRDTSLDAVGLESAAYRKLVERSDDPALRADMPPLPHRDHRRLHDAPGVLTIEAGVRPGAVPIHDLALLNDDRTALALGEAGVVLMRRDGKSIARLDAPVYRFSMSDRRDRAIGIAPRGDAVRLTRLDFARRSADPWCDASLVACAPSYDGSVWISAMERRLLAVDASARHLEALWHNPDVSGDVIAIARSLDGSCAFLLDDGKVQEYWRYDVGYTLRDRVRLDTRLNSPAISGDGTIVGLTNSDSGSTLVCGNRNRSAKPAEGWTTLLPIPENFEALEPRVAGSWIALPLISSVLGAGCVKLLGLATHRIHLEVRLDGSPSRLGVRLDAEQMTICDDRGRGIVVELNSGHWWGVSS